MDMRKIYLATIAAAVATAPVGEIILTQSAGYSASNSAEIFSQNHPSKSSHDIATQDNQRSNDAGNNFGPPDDGGFSSGDQLLG